VKVQSRHIRSLTKAALLAGSALVATVWVIIALTAVVLVLSRTMIVEATVSKQRISMAKCSAAEQGVEQYLLSVVASELTQITSKIDELVREAVRTSVA